MSPEYESSWEYLSNEERRKKIAAHISGMHIGHRVLEESHAQQEAIQDFEARSYQLDAFNALWTARRDGADRGLIHLATGLGKTSVAVVDYAAFRQEQLEKTGLESRALFVVHQNNILEQANERFAELLPEVSRSFYSNSHKNLPDSGVTFASFQTLYNGAHRFPDDYFDYIIYDEAHHIEAKTYKKVVEHFKPNFQLGLTATPERMDEKDITGHFGEALYIKTLPEAIAEKHLATVNYNIVFDDAVKEAMQNGFEPSSLSEIQRLFEIQPRNEVIVEKIRDAQALIRQEQNVERVKTIIFCADLEHADVIADMMNGESYHSGKGEGQQAALLDAFRGNELETITVRDMFNEGVDIPDARLIIFLRTTQSATIFEQQLGRGLRKNKNKQEVTVLDFVANIERIALIRELVEKIDRSKPINRGGTRVGGNSDGPIVCGIDGELKVHGDESEFIFSQEAIDLLQRYNELKVASNRWMKMSDTDIIKLALQLSPDSPLSVNDITSFNQADMFPGVATLADRFGGIRSFQRACGFEVKQHLDVESMTNEAIIKLALDLSPDAPLKRRDIELFSKSGKFISDNQIKNRFGSIIEFQRACGFEVAERVTFKDYGNEEIVRLALGYSPDQPLTYGQISQLSKEGRFPGVTWIKSRFGSLAEFHLTCGFIPAEKIDFNAMTNEQLITVALQVSPDKPLTVTEVQILSKRNEFISLTALYGRFNNSIVNFQRACGFEVFDSSSLDNDEVIQLAKRVSPDKALSSSDVKALSNKGAFPSIAFIVKRFGSFSKFQRACGFETNYKNMDNADLIVLARQIEPTRPLTSTEINQLSKERKFPGITVIYNRFGSMKGFNEAWYGAQS